MSTDHDGRFSPTTPVLSSGPEATVLPPTASASSPLDHPTTETIMEPSETTTQSTSSASRPPSLPPSDTPSHLMLPIPTPSLNKSQSSVLFSHSIVTAEDDWSSLPPEVATADISIARKYALHASDASSRVGPLRSASMLNHAVALFQPTAVLSKPRRGLPRGNSKDDTTSISVLVKTSALLMRSLRSSTSTENKCIGSGQWLNASPRSSSQTDPWQLNQTS